ncbi:hypothetical protein [Gardnerella vaginalis]
MQHLQTTLNAIPHVSTTIKQQNAQLYQSTQAKAFSKYTPPP